eukprot:Amastigsp_a509351_102.p4 type:complete len:131 gc:universal Amastigsp_a509351_102:969-577(-)
MYSVVPQIVAMNDDGESTRESPKSVTLITSEFSSSSKMFSGLRSRCTTPSPWRYRTASRSWSTKHRATGSWNRPALSVRVRRSPPDTSSSTMSSSSSVSKTSTTEMMPGCLSALRILTSSKSRSGLECSS